MNFAESCAECRRLAEAYEAVTMGWFRVQGQLRIAAYSNDEVASDRIVEELTGIGRRREQLRLQAENHIATAHPRVACASSSL